MATKKILIGAAAAALVIGGVATASANVSPTENAKQGYVQSYPTPTDSPTAPINWVVMGDSTVAGLIVKAGNPDEPDQAGKEGCGRRDGAWPFLVKNRLGDKVNQVNKSCGGAEAIHIYQKGQFPLGFISVRPDFTIAPDPFATVTNPDQPNLLAFPQIATQIEAVNADTDLITVGVGINDFEIGRLTARCSIEAIKALFIGSPCKNSQAVQDDFRLDLKRETVRQQYIEMVLALRAKAPNAHIVLSNYMSIIPTNTAPCNVGVVGAAMQEFGPQTRGDLNWEREVVYNEVNTMVRQIVTAASVNDPNVHFMDIFTDSVGHDVCAKRGVKWFEGIKDENGEYPLVHGNEMAHEYQAGKYEGMIKQLFPGRV